MNPNLADHRELLDELKGRWGFTWDPRQVAAAERRNGIFKGVAEYVFTR